MKGVPGVMVLLSQVLPLSSFSGSLMPCTRRGRHRASVQNFTETHPHSARLVPAGT